MNYGILTEPTCLKLFEKINKRPYCERCHSDRIQFAKHDMKHNDSYSNMFLGFSSEIVKIPLDVLIVAEAHGGGSKKWFRPQLALENEVNEFAEYYLNEPLKKFNQKQTRAFLRVLNEKRKTWAFTDLIKCFVSQKDKKNNLKGRDNKRIAIQHCRNYLDEQIEILKPKKVLCLGRTVAEQYFELKKPGFKHGSVHKLQIKNHEFSLIYSIFPSRNTADLWVANKGWEPILTRLI